MGIPGQLEEPATIGADPSNALLDQSAKLLWNVAQLRLGSSLYANSDGSVA